MAQKLLDKVEVIDLSNDKVWSFEQAVLVEQYLSKRSLVAARHSVAIQRGMVRPTEVTRTAVADRPEPSMEQPIGRGEAISSQVMSSTTIYFGNLPFSYTESEVRALFEPYGAVDTVRLITDRYTGRFRGFGFVEMDPEAAEAAIAALDGSEFGDRPLKVNEARPRESRPSRRW
jgi:hypothetical protein